MSLFLVNRYLGDEEDEDASKESRSQALLAKLQQKAKDKRTQALIDPGDEGAEQKQVKKKRKAEKQDSEEPKRKKEPKEDKPVALKKKKRKEKQQEEKQQSGSPAECDSDSAEIEGAEDAKQENIEPENGSVPQSPEKPSSAETGFTVLGGFESKPVKKVYQVLPQWLAKPNVIHRDIKTNLVPVSEVPGICSQLQKKLQDNGIQNFFPVQAEVIPAILEGAKQGFLIGRGGYKPRDICVSAPTGSGKTLSFVIPVLQVLMQRVVCEVRALVVLPTKELAQQVYKVFDSYAEGTALKVVILSGQKSFAAEQASLLETRGVKRSAADIVVATPGRLVDHITKDSGLCLQQLRFLIIDEADRMIDSMHQSWLAQVVKAVYSEGGKTESASIFRRTEPTCITAASLSPPQMPLQKLLFSATLTQNPEKLQRLGLHQPQLFSSIQVRPDSVPTAPSETQGRYDFPEGLTEFYVPCTLDKKPLLILHFILQMKLRPVLCFTNSREAAHRLCLLVKLFGGAKVAEFSSRLSPAQRKKTLRDFEQEKIQLLISTDAAARGIDINGVKCVINYDAPQFIRTYIHRIGRTARAGKAGLAFTFLLRVQEKNFLQMVAEAGSPGIQKQMVKPQSLQSMEVQYEQTLRELAEAIKGEARC